MALDITQLENDIYAIVAPIISPTPLIFENENAPRPSGDYAALKLVSFDQVGYGEIGEVDGDGLVDVKANYTVSVRYTGYRTKAKEIITNLNFRLLNDPNFVDAFQAIGMNPFNTPVISDIPIFRDSVWEERSSTTINYHFAYAESIDVGLIETVIYDGTYYKPDGTIAVQTTNTVPQP